MQQDRLRVEEKVPGGSSTSAGPPAWDSRLGSRRGSRSARSSSAAVPLIVLAAQQLKSPVDLFRRAAEQIRSVLSNHLKRQSQTLCGRHTAVIFQRRPTQHNSFPIAVRPYLYCGILTLGGQEERGHDLPGLRPIEVLMEELERAFTVDDKITWGGSVQGRRQGIQIRRTF